MPTIKLLPIISFAVLAATIAACNLSSDENEQDISPATATSIPYAAATIVTHTPLSPTSTPASQVTNPAPPTIGPLIDDCPPPDGWTSYIVISGDTLFSLAQRHQTTVQAIASASCLTNRDRIVTGQVLYLPDPCAGRASAACASGAERGYLEVYLVVLDDDGVNGTWIGCGASGVLQSTDQTSGDDIAENIRHQFEYLLSLEIGDRQLQAENKGFFNPLYRQPISVSSVTVDGGRLTIEFGGSLNLVGVCNDAMLESQILLTAFHYQQIESAHITVSGQNIRQIFDMSGGQAGLDEIYTRDKLVWPGS